MSDEIDHDPTCFEVLVGRFFDGELTDAEDREFVALLEADPVLARHFVEMARLDRALSAISSPHRVSDAAFDAAVRKGLEFQGDTESREFAAQVVQLVRDGSDRRRTRRLASAQHVRRAGQFSAAAIAAIACVTVAALALLFFTRTETPVATAPSKPVATPSETVVVAPENNSLPNSPAPPVPPAAPKQDGHRDALAANKNVLPPAANTPRVEPHGPAEIPVAPTERDFAIAPEIPGDFVDPDQNALEMPPAPKTEPAREALRGPSLARVERLSGVTATVQRNGALADASAPLIEGDVLRIALVDSSPGDTPAKAAAPVATPGADVTLADGSRLWLSPGSEFRFHVENQSACPTLNAGIVTAHVRPQPAGHSLKIRTQQGPVVEVVGTVFTLAAETAKKKVSLRVDEGKVLFTAQNVERKVAADETCDAEDGHAPGQVVHLKPTYAVAFGTVLDKTTGKPFDNAMVLAIPQSRRKADVHSVAVKADAQGKFRFDALREGNYFIIAQPDNANGATQVRFALARARLKAGDETVVNLTADKPAIVVGAVEESGKRLLLTNYRVRFLAEGSEGLTFNPVLFTDGQPHDAEYHCAVIEGSGKYVPVVEKPGLLIKVRTPQRVQLLNDRLNQWILDVQSSPSASIKGRILDTATSAALTDDPAADANDQRAARTTVTLTPASGGPSYLLSAESDGTYLFNTNLDAGAYELKAQRPGFAPLSKRVTLTAGQAVELDLPLERAKR